MAGMGQREGLELWDMMQHSRTWDALWFAFFARLAKADNFVRPSSPARSLQLWPCQPSSSTNCISHLHAACKPRPCQTLLVNKVHVPVHAMHQTSSLIVDSDQFASRVAAVDRCASQCRGALTGPRTCGHCARMPCGASQCRQAAALAASACSCRTICLKACRLGPSTATPAASLGWRRY